MTVRRSEGGRTAVSHYRVVKEFESIYGKFALVEVKIETGRTHQTRPSIVDWAPGSGRYLVWSSRRN